MYKVEFKSGELVGVFNNIGAALACLRMMRVLIADCGTAEEIQLRLA